MNVCGLITYACVKTIAHKNNPPINRAVGRSIMEIVRNGNFGTSLVRQLKTTYAIYLAF